MSNGFDFTKPIYAEIEEDPGEAIKFRAYLSKHNIRFNEERVDHKTIDGVRIFECFMTPEELYKANIETTALFYQ